MLTGARVKALSVPEIKIHAPLLVMIPIVMDHQTADADVSMVERSLVDHPRRWASVAPELARVPVETSVSAWERCFRGRAIHALLETTRIVTGR